MPRPPLHVRIARWFSDRVQSLSDTRERVADWFGSTFGRFFDSLLSAFDSFDELEALVIRVVLVLAWPFVFLARVLRIGPLFSLLFHLPGRLAGWWYERLLYVAQLLHIEGAVTSVASVLALLATPFTAVTGFLYAWVVTRRARELALAVPALLLLAPFVYVAVAGAMRGGGGIAVRYQQAVRESQEAGQHAHAELFRQKLAQLGVSTSRDDYIDALKLIDDGDLAQGYERMKEIAPPELPGYAAAHYWIAQRLLAGELTEEDDPALADPQQRLIVAEQHLDRITELGSTGPVLAMMKAYVLAETKRVSQACEILTPYADDSFHVAAMRLRLLMMNEDRVTALEQAENVLDLFDKLELPAARLTPEDHRSRALAAMLLKDHPQTEAALLTWMQASTDDERPREMLASLSRQLVEEALASDFFAWSPMVHRLCRAERLGSPPPWVIGQLNELIRLRPHSNPARDAWLGLLGASQASDRLIELAGTVAAAAGEVTQARKAFLRLTADRDATPTVWNNLAWTLIQDPQPLPTEAFKAVERSLAAEPDNFRFRETRGQVHVQLKQWRQAIEDLQYALNAMPDSREIHRGLARAYEALGDEQLADIHRQRSGDEKETDILSSAGF